MERRHFVLGGLALAIGSAPALAAKGAGVVFAGSWSGKVSGGSAEIRVTLIKLDGTVGGTIIWPGGWSSFSGRVSGKSLRGRISKGGNLSFTLNAPRQMRGSFRAGGKTYSGTFTK